METSNPLHLMNASDHAELTLIRRRAEYLKLKSNVELWENFAYRAMVDAAFADVKDGIGVKVTKS